MNFVHKPHNGFMIDNNAVFLPEFGCNSSMSVPLPVCVENLLNQ